mmetsp:Transcript_35620/g.76069  ORF Transcript_35620/g.76069 Transcript_35620/m.76069 type:complete len:437 (-) Transcript_35620:3-1313(-)
MTNKKCGQKRSPSPCTPEDEGPTCWICLCGGADESGQPLRRDCSCRGNAGFVHLGCLVGYAENVTSEMDEGDSGKFIQAWTACPNCCQDYEHDLCSDLVARCNSFVEANYSGDLFLACHAVYLKLRKLAIRKENKGRGAEVATEVISIVEQMRAENPSQPRAILYFEIAAYETLALFAEFEGTRDSLKDAVEFHTRCRDIYQMIGIPTDLPHAEACIAQARAKLNGLVDGKGGGGGWTKEDAVRDCRDYYDESLEESGENSSVTMISMFRLADALRAAHRGVEAERLMTRLSTIANRVHGSKHDFTRDVEESLMRSRRRHVSVRGKRGKQFEALRYEGEDKCVVRGPLSKPRKINEEKTFTVHNHQIRPALGSPVTCHGLEASSNLNGKMGNVLSRKKGAQKYTVHFEDESLEPCLVHPNNMRIVFKLPGEEYYEK